jgi:hypothetical protein
LLVSLKAQLVFQQRLSDDQKYGAMLAKVDKALTFKRHCKKHKRKDARDDDDEKDTSGRFRK